MAWICFDVLLVRLFSPLSTLNYIIGTRKQKTNHNKTEKVQMGLDELRFMEVRNWETQ